MTTEAKAMNESQIDQLRNELPGPVAQLLDLGEPDTWGHVSDPTWIDYRGLGIGDEHTQALCQLLTTSGLNYLEQDRPELYGVVHAWRALGQLRLAEAADDLVGMIAPFHALDDDQSFEEMPVVLGMIGEPAIAPLRVFLEEKRDLEVFARVPGAVALRQIAQRHPETRLAVIDILSQRLTDVSDDDPTWNAMLVSELAELRAVEAEAVIREAYGRDLVDESMCGVLDDVIDEIEGRPPQHRKINPKWNLLGPSFGPAVSAKSPGVAPDPYREKAKKRRERKKQRRNRKKNRR